MNKVSELNFELRPWVMVQLYFPWTAQHFKSKY